MTDPIKPVGPGAIDATEALSEVAGAEDALPLQGATQAQTPVAVDPLDAAIQDVAADIQAGRVPDAEAASEAVIIRIVNLRYPHLGDAQRNKMILHLHEMMHRDPQFLARIERLIELAQVS